jgi:hypothetical protein
MFFLIIMLIVVRQLLLYAQIDIVYFSFFVPFLILSVETLKKRPTFNNFINRDNPLISRFETKLLTC